MKTTRTSEFLVFEGRFKDETLTFKSGEDSLRGKHLRVLTWEGNKQTASFELTTENLKSLKAYLNDIDL